MLELNDLHRRYGAATALDGLSFGVAEGALYGFVGANGAGKTTTMRIVMGVERADSGGVTWRGETPGAATRRRFGYMPEERGLYPKMRVAPQLAYLAQLHGVEAAAARAAAVAWLDRLGLADRASDRVEQLSLGNQQRVQLAAALVAEPELLVLDEPFSGLDPVGVDALAEVLAEQTTRGVAVLFSSHQLELVERLCDGVAIVDAGRLVASGTVEELRRGNGARQLRVDVRGRPHWADRLPGVSVAERAPGSVVLDLHADADEQRVLRAALDAGPVDHFGIVEVSLAERFREVVTAGREA